MDAVYIKSDFNGRLALGSGHVIPVEAGKPCQIPQGLLTEAVRQPGICQCDKSGKEIKQDKGSDKKSGK